jgi:hypothetical protein
VPAVIDSSILLVIRDESQRESYRWRTNSWMREGRNGIRHSLEKNDLENGRKSPLDSLDQRRGRDPLGALGGDEGA